METSILELLTSKIRYKELQSSILPIAEGDMNIIKSSIEAIKNVLSFSKYKIDCKLVSVRYLKDCFVQGNTNFISEVENQILPLLRKVLEDKKNQKSFSKYAQKQYQTKDQMKFFKSQIMTLFQLVQECIVNWGIWLKDYNKGSNGFAKLLNVLKQQNMLTLMNNKYFQNSDKTQFQHNFKSIKHQSKQISNILKRVEDLGNLDKNSCRKQIISLTNQIQDTAKTMKVSVRASIQHKLKHKISRISFRNDKIIDEINQTQSINELTVIQQHSDKENTQQCVQLQINSSIYPQIYPLLRVKNSTQHNSQFTTDVGSIMPSKHSQSISVLESIKSEISTWQETLKLKLSQINIQNFKLSLLKQTRKIYSNEVITIFYAIRKTSSNQEEYQINLLYKIHNKSSRISVKNMIHDTGIKASSLARISDYQYKQTICLTNMPLSKLIFWGCQVDKLQIEFPLPFSIINILLKGLMSKTKANSCFKQHIQTRISKINPNIAKQNTEILRFFNNVVKARSPQNAECWISCLLHQFSNSMILLQMQLFGKNQIRFRIDMGESQREDVAHLLLQCLTFIFQDR